jgi:endoribonuclease Dicer
MVLQLRPYQTECLGRAKETNTIINLPTGKGKTLIAARLIDHFLEKRPDKRIAFLVPTRPLVDQQAKYLETHCTASGSPPTVLRLIGTDQACWGQSDWDANMNSCHIMLGTSALFQKVFVTNKFVSLDRISLMIYDECHNAVRNSPMASVMRDGVAPWVAEGFAAPHMLGLTASFVNGSLKNINKKRQALESLMHSTLFAPDVEDTLTEESFVSVNWSVKSAMARQIEAVEAHISEATDDIAIKDVRRIISRCAHVFTELGSSPLMFYMEKVVVQQILDKASALEHMEDAACTSLAADIRNSVPTVRCKLVALADILRSDPVLGPADEKSNKLLKLVELLKQNFDDHGQSYRGIVFVEQVALVSTLAKEISEGLASIRCGAVAGTGHQSDGDRQEQLNLFKSGECRILVATATLEEGIDVSECEFVARFSMIQTTKAHIQGSGRARHPDAKIYYFANNPTKEREKANELTATARDSTLNLSQGRLTVAMREMNVSSIQHPYPPRARNTGVGEVNVFNCKHIFNQYCSIIHGVTVNTKEHLYSYMLDGDRRMLEEIWYPTPEGWQSKRSVDYDEFWGGEDMELVFQADRTTKKSALQKEEMAFVYLVVVDLREKEYIDEHNKPRADLAMRSAARRTCELGAPQAPAGLNIKDNVFQSHNSSGVQ